MSFDRAWPWDPRSRETIFSIDLWQLWAALVFIVLIAWARRRRHRQKESNLSEMTHREP